MRNSFSFPNNLNPIFVRELRRCNRPRFLLPTVGVLYVLALCGYAGVPAFEQNLSDLDAARMIVTGGCLTWTFVGGLATFSAASTILKLPDTDPSLKLIGMTAGKQVRGYLMTLAFYACCASLLQISFVVIALLRNFRDAQFFADIIGLLALAFLGINAASAYLFSFHARAEGGIQRFVATFFASSIPIGFFIPYVLFASFYGVDHVTAWLFGYFVTLCLLFLLRG